MASHPALLTFDLEDWYQVVGRMFGFTPSPAERGRLPLQVGRILHLLDTHRTHATFFVLGLTAAEYPGLIRDIAAAGHEIATHGFGHERVTSLTPEAFTRDLELAMDAVATASGHVPTGYRAPAFSIDERSFWAFDILIDHGFRYDSSIFPFRGPRYGIPGFATQPGAVRAPSGRTLLELPLAVARAGPVRIPVAGGGYWRLLPGGVLRRAVRRVARQAPPMLYFHPAEFDDRRLAATMSTRALNRFELKQNLRRASIPKKLAGLLRTHRCVSISEYLQDSNALSLGGS
ncbi:MAG TPA: polysaccharide deacetylase family protein [Actinomycetota bacterium]|nr:polysaccharide deacetylase family protein [Actinomycetota bacterium]